MRLSLLTLCVFLFFQNYSLAASAKVTECAQTFAGSTDSSVREKEVLQTYTSLLEELGTELSPTLLKKIHDSGNPFQIPENVGTSDSVRAGLTQLEDILRTHTENIEPYKKLILSELLKMMEARKSTEAKVVSTLKNPKIQWPTTITEVLDLDGWYLGIPSPASPLKQILFWQQKQGFVARELSTRDWPEHSAYHEPTKSLFYTSKNGDNHTHYKLQLFDSNNQPLKVLRPETLNALDIPNSHVQSLHTSPDGKSILYPLPHGAYLGTIEANGQIKDLKLAYNHFADPTRAEAEAGVGYWVDFLTKSKIGIRTPKKFLIVNYPGSKNTFLPGFRAEIQIPLKKGLRNVVLSLDEKYLFISYFPSNKAPFAERWDLTNPKTKLSTKPITFKLGDPVPLESGHPADGKIFPLLGTPHVLYFYSGPKNKGPFELRVIDVSTSEILYKEPIPSTKPFYWPQLSRDHSRLHAYLGNEDNSPTYLWDTKHFKDAL